MEINPKHGEKIVTNHWKLDKKFTETCKKKGAKIYQKLQKC